MPEVRLKYIFPFQISNKWITQALYGDTIKVLSQGQINVPAGTFENTFLLSETGGFLPNTLERDTIWLTPNIGMTKFYQHEWDLRPIPGNGTWELKSYDLK